MMSDIIYTFLVTLLLIPPASLASRGPLRSPLEQTNKPQEIKPTVSDYDFLLSIDPDDGLSYFYRGYIYFERKQYEMAIKDFTNAIRLNARAPEAYYCRGRAFADWQKTDEAIKDFTNAIRLDDNFIDAYIGRGMIYEKKRAYRNALADYRHVIRVNSGNAQAHNNLAWILATCPKKDIRQAKEAVDLATRACELSAWKNCHSIDTLAAAYAACGDYDNAVKWQKKAIGIGLLKAEALETANRRLKLYEQHTPYIQDQ